MPAGCNLSMAGAGADFVKVGVFWLLYRYNAFNIKCDRLIDQAKRDKKSGRLQAKAKDKDAAPELMDIVDPHDAVSARNDSQPVVPPSTPNESFRGA